MAVCISAVPRFSVHPEGVQNLYGETVIVLRGFSSAFSFAVWSGRYGILRCFHPIQIYAGIDAGIAVETTVLSPPVGGVSPALVFTLGCRLLLA